MAGERIPGKKHENNINKVIMKVRTNILHETKNKFVYINRPPAKIFYISFYKKNNPSTCVYIHSMESHPETWVVQRLGMLSAARASYVQGIQGKEMEKGRKGTERKRKSCTYSCPRLTRVHNLRLRNLGAPSPCSPCSE